MIKIITMLALTLLSFPVFAHIDLTSPPMRNGNQKMGPCENAPRGAATVVNACDTLTVEWNETIDHTGHYRIALNLDGDTFTNPSVANGQFVMNNSPEVVMDGIPESANMNYSETITVPNVNCNNCTIQVIQVMETNPANYNEGSDLYFRCTDIEIVGADPNLGVDCLSGDMGGGMPDMGTGEMDMGAANNVNNVNNANNANNVNNVNNVNPNNANNANNNNGTDGDTTNSINGEGGCATATPANPLLALLFVALIAIRRRD